MAWRCALSASRACGSFWPFGEAVDDGCSLTLGAGAALEDELGVGVASAAITLPAETTRRTELIPSAATATIPERFTWFSLVEKQYCLKRSIKPRLENIL